MYLYADSKGAGFVPAIRSTGCPVFLGMFADFFIRDLVIVIRVTSDVCGRLLMVLRK